MLYKTVYKVLKSAKLLSFINFPRGLRIHCSAGRDDGYPGAAQLLDQLRPLLHHVHPVQDDLQQGHRYQGIHGGTIQL